MFVLPALVDRISEVLEEFRLTHADTGRRNCRGMDDRMDVSVLAVLLIEVVLATARCGSLQILRQKCEAVVGPLDCIPAPEPEDRLYSGGKIASMPVGCHLLPCAIK